MRGLDQTAFTAMVRVVGSGWRPTRFVEAVPPHRICNLCRILPESNVLLPCHHVLCDSCHAGCQVRENGGVCALDGIPFSLQDCRKNQLPTSTAETVGAHCWNEVQGCGFVGKLGDMLRHYEQDCAFHAVLCPRCGNWVRRCNMPNHYAAGCPPAGPAARASEPPSRPTVVDVTSVLRQFMSHVKAQDQMLPSLQSTLNTLHEKAGIHSARLEQVAGDVRESEQRLKHDLARTAEHLATKIARDVKVHQRDSNQSANVGSGDGTVGDGNDKKLSTCWRAEKRHILHKLELAADDSMSCLRDIRHCMARLLHGRQLADDPGCEALAGVHYMSTWAGGKDSALYRLCVTGAESLLTSSAVYPGLFSSAKVWYSRSAYFVAVLGTTKWEDKLDLYFRWCSTTECPAPAPKQFGVTLVHADRRQDKTMERDHREGLFPAGGHHRFWTRLSDLRRSGFVREDTLTFNVAVSGDLRPSQRGNGISK